MNSTFIGTTDIERWSHGISACACVSLFVLAALGVIIGGCKEEHAGRDKHDRYLAIAELTRIAEESPVPEYRERAKLALSEYGNTILDPKPVFIEALLAYEVPDRFDLWIACFDEDRDLHGIRIREQVADANQAPAILEEDYPVFVDQDRSLTVEARLIPVCIRDKQLHKDESLWKEYEDHILMTPDRRNVAADKSSPSVAHAPERLLAKIPPVYIFLPRPNHVHVQIRAYDALGHESEWIEVRPASSLSYR